LRFPFVPDSRREIRLTDHAPQTVEPLTPEAALAKLANLQREQRVADALLQIESLDLNSVLDRICRLTVELMPADRVTAYLYSNRARGFVSIADHGTPAHIFTRFAPKMFFGQSRVGASRARIPFRDDLAAGRIGCATRDDATDPELLALLDDLELYAMCLVPLRSSTRGALFVSLVEPPPFDDTAFRIVHAVARQASNLVDHSRTFRKLQHAARVRAGFAALAAAVNLETDPARIARLVSAEVAALFRISSVALLVAQRDGLVVLGAHGLDADGYIPLQADTSALVEAYRHGTPVFQNELDESPMADGPLRREFRLRSILALPLAGRDGPLGCFLLGDRTNSHGFSREIADEALVLGSIASAALERAALFQQVERSEEHFRSLIENASDLIAIVGRDGTLRYQSPSIERMLGWGRDQFVGRPVAERIHADDRTAFGEMLAAALDSTAPCGVREARFRHRDGSWRVLEGLGTRMVATDGAPVVVVTLRDVTERKRAEREIAEARDQALAATRLKSEFLANMSHEVRTPMNAVIGMADLLAESPLTDEQRDFVTTIRTSAHALLTVINDILDVSKIEAGKLAIEHTDFDLRSLLEGVADLFAPRAFEKRLELSCVVPPDLPEYVVGDPHRLRQVLTNLLANAIKFTDRGRVSLEAALLEQSAARARVRLTVRDTGIGISTDRQQAVFDTFTQADGSTARRYGGTGLGLTISRHLIELMGGRIGLDSEPGCGSNFWVEIDLEKQLDRAATGAHPPPGLAGLRVLVIDAYAPTRRVLRAQLERWGCAAAEAETAVAALRVLRAVAERDPYRLVLLDVDIADGEGELVAQSIHGDPRLAELAVVVLCSTGGRASVAQARAGGFAAAVPKPIHRGQLREVVCAAAARLRGDPEPPLAGQ
jgi:PAS domain S-box-containing protein